MSSTFSVNVETQSNRPLVRLSGEIDVHSCTSLSETLENIVANASQNVILNMQDTHYLDSSGLGTIAYSAKLLSDKNHDMIIICNRPQIKKLFDLSGLSSKNIQFFENDTDINF